MSEPEVPGAAPKLHFIRRIVGEDRAAGKFAGRVHTRFPPEPNGYLHIGHAKAICLDFGIAQEFNGYCNLRFDDTNPLAEEEEYVVAMQEDLHWLGFDWGDRMFFASDYYGRMYQWAEDLVTLGLAYVDDQSADEIRETRGTLTEPGRESPWRNRTVAENLFLLRRMRAGDFENGAKVLRAKIDMASPNINLRDPIMYRILKASHHRTGNAWCIYPMYDWAHPLSDSIEGITHSFCTLEFEDHRPLYDWFLEMLDVYRPQQIEFARLVLSHTIVSKRKLRQLVDDKLVDGWDDPRMPTLRAMRRRGYPPEAIRDFCERVGVAKDANLVDVQLLEYCVRERLNQIAPRVMGVLRPLKVVITSVPEGQVEEVDAVNNPEDEAAGTRKLPFSREVWIEETDFLEDPPPKYFRLRPGGEVRLRWAYVIRCDEVIKDASGRVVELRCTHDPGTKGGGTPDGRKIKGTIHWVSAAQAVPATVRLYETLFSEPDPTKVEEGGDWKSYLNPKSREVVEGCYVEPGLKGAAPGTTVQFERLGYFCVDRESGPAALVFNRTVGLRDTWAKIAAKG
ncbi:MAG: glutamine--tRNA ligase/YqeY domain fusion protein [bacterium]